MNVLPLDAKPTFFFNFLQPEITTWRRTKLWGRIETSATYCRHWRSVW